MASRNIKGNRQHSLLPCFCLSANQNLSQYRSNTWWICG